MASYPEKHYLDASSAKMDPELEAAVQERPRSCSAVGSDVSSTSSLGRYRPMSTGSSAHSNTLVQPRPWRFLHKSRLGSSLERERATEEDTSLEGDHDDRRSEEDEIGSSVDGDLVVKRRKEEKGGGSRDRMDEASGGTGSPVDAVVRTKSDSDIAVQKELMGNGDAPRMVVFKSRAERFSRKDDKAAAPQHRTSSPFSKSQTLPLSLPPQLLAAAAGSSGVPAEKSSTLPPSSAPIARLAEVTSSTDELSDKPKLGEAARSKPVSEAITNKRDVRRHSLDDRRLADDRRNAPGSDVTGVSPIMSDRPASVWDSPTRSITLNMQDISPSVAFSKTPAEHVQPVTLQTPPSSEQLDLQKTSTPKSPDKPKVPAKPARRISLKSGSPAREGSLSSSASPTRAGPPKPPRTTLDQNRRSSSSLGSPKTPEETVLFSMGFTVVDDEQKPAASKQNHNGLQDCRPKPKPDVFEFPQKKDETVEKNKDISPGVHNEIKTEMYSDQDIADVFAEAESGRDLEHPSQPDGDPQADVEPKEQEIVAKKMTKVKGDKKAEEKASKAKKKEQKAKEKEMRAKEKELKAKEKEAKAKMKAAAKDDTHHEKSRVKLFPWKVEFSAKDKGPSDDTVDAARPTGDDENAEGTGQRVSAPTLSVEPIPSSAVPEAISLQFAAATGSKRTGPDRGDGAGSRSPSERSPSEKSSSQETSPSTPPSSSPQEEEQDVPPPLRDELQQQQQQHHQQLQEASPRSPSKKQQQQQASPSSPSRTLQEDRPSSQGQHNPSPPPTTTTSSPQPDPQQQHYPQHPQLQQPDLQQQQPSPQPQRPGAAVPQQSPQPQRHREASSQPSPQTRHKEVLQASPRPHERLVGEEEVFMSSSCSSAPGSPARHHTPPQDELSSSDPGSSDLDSLSGAATSLRPRRARQGRGGPQTSQSVRVRVSESDGEATSPDGEGPGRRLQGAPRRHTVGGAQIRDQMGARRDDSDRKREAFYELLATRYPQYADKITMATHQPTTAAERNPRPREPQRRRTTVATYNPQSSHLLDHDDLGTMSDVEPSSFQRGGIARASLPIVRSASSSLERPIGLVFLVFGDETKKSLLPNEITSLDTVRALFVRAFPDKLSMEFLDSPKRKIYILEAATNIFFQLEDLRDIQDRTVLKIHECDSDELQRVRTHPESRGRVQQVAVSSRPSSRQGYASDTGIHYDMAKVQSLPIAGQTYQELMQRERAQWELEQEFIHAQQRRSRSRSQTPELAERPRSLSTGAPRNRYSHSPDRMSTPERAPPPPQPHSLGPIPENPRLLANGFRQAALNQNGSHYEVLPGRGGSHQQHPGAHPHPHPHAHPHPGAAPGGRVLSPPTVGQQPIYESVYQPGGGGYHHPQAYVIHSMRTVPPQGPQRATGPPPPDMRGGNRNDPASRHSLAFAAMSNPIYESFPQRAQSYRATPERDVVAVRPHSAAPHDVNRMERMEAQIASLAAWVHHVHASPTDPAHRRGPGSSRSTSTSSHSEGTDTYPGSSASKENDEGSVSASPGLSDIPGSYSVRQPMVSVDMREKMNDMQCRLKELRVELQGLKRMEQLHKEAMRDAFTDTLFKIKKVMGSSGKTDNIYGELLQLSSNSPADVYLRDKAKVEHDLRGLETKVEGVKEDVLTRRCHINVNDIEGQAFQLSHITKSIADLKARFPQVHEALKSRSGAEARDLNEEQFLREEPAYIEAALKRCKTLTSNLVTLKRLATAQDTSTSPEPPLPVESKPGDDEVEDTMAILENIRAMVPDFDARIQSLEAAESHKSMHLTSSTSVTDSRHPSIMADIVDSPRCEPPQVPAKPARLLSASEIKQHLGAATASVVAPVSMSPHTVTVTSQIGDQLGDSAIYADRHSARSVFFSSMQSPPTSPALVSESGKTSSTNRLPTTTTKAGAVSSAALSPSVSSSASSLTSPSHSKALSGVYYQAVSPTRTRSAFSSIPLPNRADKDDSSKGKKVPPPPPPRTSSAKLYCSPLSPNGGVATSTGRRNSGERSPDARKKDSSLSVFKPTSPTSPGAKPGIGQKPAMNKFQKDIAAGIYANLNRPDLQHQKMAPDRLITTMAPVAPAPAAVVTNSQDPQEEGDLSGSESTGSSTSLDSQQGAALLRSNSSAGGRGPKPNPPQRHSSLSSRGSLSEESGGKSKTQMLQERVRRSQEAGSSRRASSGALGQVNGVDSATRNGHKT